MCDIARQTFKTKMIYRVRKTVNCRAFGLSTVQYSHSNKAVLEGCSKDNAIRYHSLHDNAYIRTFAGHTERVTNISMNVVNDSFFSASCDRTVRLWDLRTPKCIARLKVEGRPTVACDTENMVFAVGNGSNEIKMYDSRSYEGGPFETFRDFPMSPPSASNKKNKNASLSIRQEFEWCSLLFSPDGAYLLISTRTNMLILVDSMKGTVSHIFDTYSNKNNLEIHGSFSGDGKYVSIGSTDGDISTWNAKTGEAITAWRGHPKPVRFFQWNPKYLMGASAAQSVAFWIPPEESKVISEKPMKSSLRKVKVREPTLTSTSVSSWKS